MKRQEIIAQLRGLRHTHGRINPDHAWVSRNRHLLLQQIRNTVSAPDAAITPRVSFDRFLRLLSRGANLFLPKNIVALSRSAVALLLVLAVTVSGWIATVSAANSLPGEPLYQVKLAKEKTELIVASALGTEEDTVNTLLKHASNRVEEYQKSKNSSQAAQAIQSLKKSIESTSQSLAVSQSGSSATAVAKAVNEKTDQLLQSLEHPAGPDATLGATSTSALSGVPSGDAVNLQKEVGEASRLIAVTGVKAAEVLVQKKLDGDTTVNLNEVKASVEKKLDKLVTDFSQISKDVASVGTMVASSTVAKESSTSTAGITQPKPTLGDNSTTSTTIATTTVTAGVIKETVKATEQKVGEANKVVEKTVAEAKTLIDNNDLLGALKKVQELAGVKKETASVVIDAKAVTDTIISSTSTANNTSATAPAGQTTAANTTTGAQSPPLGM